jgi:hypothetical protein
MVCLNCDGILPDGANFCGRCGTAVHAETPAVHAPDEAPTGPVRTGEPPRNPSRFQGFAEALVPLGDFLGGFVAQPLVFLLVLTGTVEATGAPPGGVLRGPLGAVLAFGLHALWGVLAAVCQVVGWLALFLTVFGLLGAVRRRGRWYIGPLGVLVWIGAAVAFATYRQVADWLGSVSSSDAAPLWAAFVGAYISMGGRLPLWGSEVWKWTNSHGGTVARMSYFRRVGLLHQELMGSDTREGMGKSIISLVEMSLMFGLCLIGWRMNGWAGVIVAVLIFATIWGFARALLWLVGGFLVSIFVVLPLSAVLAIWEPYLEGPGQTEAIEDVISDREASKSQPPVDQSEPPRPLRPPDETAAQPVAEGMIAAAVRRAGGEPSERVMGEVARYIGERVRAGASGARSARACPNIGWHALAQVAADAWKYQYEAKPATLKASERRAHEADLDALYGTAGRSDSAFSDYIVSWIVAFLNGEKVPFGQVVDQELRRYPRYTSPYEKTSPAGTLE